MTVVSQNCALLVVPHQDDETNLAGNVIDALKYYWDLFVLYSSLDSDPIRGAVRKKEAVRACSVWGIQKSHIQFLEYPDTPNRTGTHFYSSGDMRIENDLERYILELKPELIIATDFDYHSDHRMLSLALDRTIGRLLRQEAEYRPIVLKGFCYETAFYGAADYRASRPNYCVPQFIPLSNPAFEWSKRISIRSTEQKCVIWRRKAYKALVCHRSQHAVLHANSIVNDDNVFWQKRTDNLLSSAKLSASAGDVEIIRDFLIVDTKDIITENPREIDYSRAVWSPMGNEAWIKAEWAEDITFDQIIIHGNPAADYPQDIAIKIFADGVLIGELNSLREFGRETVLRLEPMSCSQIMLTVDAKEKRCGISELEILKGEQLLPIMLGPQPEEEPQSKKKPIDIWNNLGFQMIVLITKIIRKVKKIVQKVH